MTGFVTRNTVTGSESKTHKNTKRELPLVTPLSIYIYLYIYGYSGYRLQREVLQGFSAYPGVVTLSGAGYDLALLALCVRTCEPVASALSPLDS